MISSRRLEDLRPEVAALARRFLMTARREGIDLIVTSTYRDAAAQDALYAQGRTGRGPVVTNARGWSSWHQYRVAFDVVPVIGGKLVWGDKKLWDRIGKLGEGVGLEWGGRWPTFTDRPHFQLTQGKTRKQLRAEIEASSPTG
ncbi:D-alanyl-D-alanine carboxypeptidase [uncultured Caudovirales phage]|uniref:D-alanyl-D-alanine carboxypeptidase n=1 Tax=uncultured Caudovirales phage TaxID=2100421 RepID=A0A6J5S8J2_9CAUD|nr:D-alanyl-D-alanine carboxypeptidase [uncultured Caudovirales phage]CAB4205201.1 D-alanyl-D-alanine carboxypeptidase [uncultured Caudovirales phage]